MVMMSDLPHDLVDDVLSRAPLTSLRAVRRTCKTWNDISNGRSFIKKHIGKAKAAKKEELQGIMVMFRRVYRISFSLHGIHNNVVPSIKREARFISLKDANPQEDIFRVFHCDGLLLCTTRDIKSKIMVWNPYLGQKIWIKPRNSYLAYDSYALGYESGKKNSRHSHKILRKSIYLFDLYSFKSNAWKVLDVTPNCVIDSYQRGMSLKGNTYWYAKQKYLEQVEETDDFLICFDFTTERFGPHLPLPFHSASSPTLSTVGEEQIAVLCRRQWHGTFEIWVTSKIEPKKVSWNKLFLTFDMFRGIYYHEIFTESFFIDQKNNAAVVIIYQSTGIGTRNIAFAYIIGNNGYSKHVDLGLSKDQPLVCSYVPSSVQIKHVTY